MALAATDRPFDDFDAADPLAVAHAVRRTAEQLRTQEWEPESLVRLIARLVALSRDPSARVRQSVAEATPYLPEPTFRELVPVLLKDNSPYVRDAAQRAERRRSTLRRTAVQGEEHDSRVDRWYRELDKPGKKGARAIAQRIALHETEYFVRRMVHEASSSFMTFTETSKKLRRAIEEPEVDRAALRAAVDRLDERFAFFRHVLETGRTHAQAAEPEFARENLAAIVADEATLLRTLFPEREARIEVDLSGVDRSLVIDADAGFLRQALAKILKNAVESYAARAEGAIVIRVSAVVDASDVVVTVADEGCGMHAEDVERAFVPFGSSKPGGTGFGLFIARRVARQVHGGELTLTSTFGAGTTVTMTLPLRQETSATKRRRR